jgi:hypothetical protein
MPRNKDDGLSEADRKVEEKVFVATVYAALEAWVAADPSIRSFNIRITGKFGKPVKTKLSIERIR